MRFVLAFIFCIALGLSPAFAGGNNLVKKHKGAAPAASAQQSQQTPSAQVSPEAAPGLGMPNQNMDQVMMMATQAALSAVPPDQMQQLSECINKHVDKDTGQNLTGAVMSGMPGSYAMAQQFQNSPQGQQAISACNAQISVITPIVMQELFKMMGSSNNSSLFSQ